MAARTVRSSDGDELLRTIEAVHAAGLDAELWPDALRSVSKLFGAVGATLEVFDKRTMTLRDLRVVGLPDGAEIPYVEYYARHNTRANYALRNLSQKILCDYRLTDERAMDRDPYYVEYLRSIGLRYFATAQIIDTPELHGIISVQRSRKQGHVERRDLDRMRRLLPHFSQAYEMTMRLRNNASTSRVLMHALDWLADGVLLVRADGTVLYANESMRAIARQDDGIRIARGALDFTAVKARAQFEAAVGMAKLARSDASITSPIDFRVDRPRGKPPYLVSVRALGGGRGEQADAIVFVRDPLARNVAAAEYLRDLLGLTDAEANLAHALHSGMTIAEYARTRMLSLNTVYTHLRRIKEKTGCKRQAELIGRLNDLQLPLRG
jgi:DNA-binding CsgD family transcriptional regulator